MDTPTSQLFLSWDGEDFAGVYSSEVSGQWQRLRGKRDSGRALPVGLRGRTSLSTTPRPLRFLFWENGEGRERPAQSLACSLGREASMNGSHTGRLSGRRRAPLNETHGTLCPRSPRGHQVHSRLPGPGSGNTTVETGALLTSETPTRMYCRVEVVT